MTRITLEASMTGMRSIWGPLSTEVVAGAREQMQRLVGAPATETWLAHLHRARPPSEELYRDPEHGFVLLAQETHVALAQAQIERSAQTMKESMELQRLGVARQAQVQNVALPLIAVLLLLIGYLLVKWRDRAPSSRIEAAKARSVALQREGLDVTPSEACLRVLQEK